ncbi:MAG TPA: HNH endonuclease [Xanthobacteraceae bacterium]|jgi:hypothetical protein|nr:HNH endonuclease [Xanthobacteraceae bacterium]
MTEHLPPSAKSGTDHPNIDARLAALNTPRKDCLYYAITLTADRTHKIIFGLQTEWVGWADDTQRHELRQGRIVYSDFVKLWEALEQPFAFVHTVDDAMLFFLSGGNALVEKELAERLFPGMIKPHHSIPDGPTGFKGPGMFEATAFRRAPTPKIRMQVLNRDGRRCRICGRRPDDDTDVILHVHHIRPWEKGGVTDIGNLVTLCHTCHIGLEPHEDHSLFRHTSNPAEGTAEFSMLEFREGVANYRKRGFLGADEEPRRRKPRHRRARSGNLSVR